MERLLKLIQWKQKEEDTNNLALKIQYVQMNLQHKTCAAPLGEYSYTLCYAANYVPTHATNVLWKFL